MNLVPFWGWPTLGSPWGSDLCGVPKFRVSPEESSAEFLQGCCRPLAFRSHGPQTVKAMSGPRAYIRLLP